MSWGGFLSHEITSQDSVVTSTLLLISICLGVRGGVPFLRAQNLFALSPPPTHSRWGREQTRIQGCKPLRVEGWRDEKPAACILPEMDAELGSGGAAAQRCRHLCRRFKPMHRYGNGWRMGTN